MTVFVSKKMIRAKTMYNGIPVPSAIALNCPHCNDYITYFCRDFIRHAPTDTITFLGWCPSCEGKISFWMINCRDYENAAIYMHPSLPGGRDVMKGVEYLPERIAENYLEAIDTYRHNYYKASISMIRASLEGIFKTFLDRQDLKNLADLMVHAAHKINFTAKIEDIADVIRNSENFIPHFSLDCKPDQHIASSLLDFLEFIIAYVYVMPEEAKRIKQDMSDLKQKSLPDS